MTLQIGDVEKRLQSLIEVHLTKYLPGPNYQDRIAQRLSEVLHASLAKKEAEGEEKIPHEYTLVVHPSTLEQWNKEPRLVEGLTKIFRLVVGELGVEFDSAPTLTITTDPLVDINDLQVRTAQGTTIAETQDVEARDKIDESAPPKPAFLIVGGTKVFTLHNAVTNIGRRLDNQLVIDDPRVSRYHAQVRYVRGRFIIFDMNSTGGTYVNGQRVSQSVLYPGDVISLAGLPIIFGQDNPPPSITTGTTAPLTPATSERSTAVLRNTQPKPKPKS